MKNLIFDFDGTIADDHKLIVKKYNAVADEFKLPKITDLEIQKFHAEGSAGFLSALPVSKLKLLLVVRRVQNDFRDSLDECHPVTGIPSVLKKLKKLGFKLGIISSNTSENINGFLKNNGIDVFDFVHSGRDLFGKDRVIRKVLKEYSLEPRETVYIGDEDRDITAARKAGLKVIAVTWGFNARALLQKNKPDVLIDTPQELLRIK